MATSFDAHKNFAISSVTIAPSPASSGTTLTIATGDGVKFPATPFNAVVYPVNTSYPTLGNAEIVRVTGISTDTFTIVRTQEGSSARSILVGDIIYNAETIKSFTDIENAINSLSTSSVIAGLTGQIQFNNAGAFGATSQMFWDNTNNVLKIGPLNPSGTITLTPSTTGGTLAAGTYYYKVTSLDGSGGESLPSAEYSVTTTGTTSSVGMSWSSVAGAINYKVYRGTTAGGENVYYTSQYDTYTDTNATSTAGTVPTSNTAYGAVIYSTGEIRSSNSFVVPNNATFQFNNSAANKNNFNIKCGTDGTFLFDQDGGNSGRFKMGNINGSTYYDFTPNYSNSILRIQDNGPVVAQHFIAKYSSTSASSTAYTVDFNQGNTSRITLTGNCTLTFNNPYDQAHYTIELIQDQAGSRTVTWPSNIVWAGGTVPTLTTTANYRDIITLIYDATVNKYLATPTLNFSA